MEIKNTGNYHEKILILNDDERIELFTHAQILITEMESIEKSKNDIEKSDGYTDLYFTVKAALPFLRKINDFRAKCYGK